jgi:hypothetical protein
VIHSLLHGKRRISNAFCSACGKECRRQEYIFLLPGEYAYDAGQGGKLEKWPWRNRARTLVRASRTLIHSL